MTLPRIYAQGREALVWRLVGYGVGHAALSFAMALSLRSVRHGSELAEVRTTIAVLLILSFALFALRVLEGRDAERLGQEYVLRVRGRLLRHLAARPYDERAAERWGVAMSRLVNDLGSLRSWVSLGFARAVSGAVALAGLLAAVAYLDPRVGAVAAAASAVLVALAAGLTPSLRRAIREARRQRGRLANEVGEKVLVAQALEHLGGTRRELRRVDRRSRALRDRLVSRALRASALRALPDLFLGLVVAGSVVALLSRAGAPATGATPGSHGAAVMMLVVLLTRPLRDLARAWNHRLAFAVAARKIESILALPVLEPKRRRRTPPPQCPPRGRVRTGAASVAVAAAPGRAALEASPGACALVVGPSGSGKTRLLHRIARLERSGPGEIRLDGTPIERVAALDLRRDLRLVSPAVPLLRGTVARNLRYGAEGASREWLDEVIEACGLGEPALFPHGLLTRVAERGLNLSSGARTRLALARAFAVRPRLLLVDDPMVLLDAGAGAALRHLTGRLAPTLLLVGEEDLSPVAPDCVWRLGPSLRLVRRARERR